VIQGGDGGMEYAMCTLILGEGTYEGLIGVIAHEMAHFWFQHVLASNESKHGWLDEGFTSFLEDLGMNEIAEKKVENPLKVRTAGIISWSILAKSNRSLRIATVTITTRCTALPLTARVMYSLPSSFTSSAGTM
jgi:hypothetical protein